MTAIRKYFDGLSNKLILQFIDKYSAIAMQRFAKLLFFSDERQNIIDCSRQVVANNLVRDLRKSLFYFPEETQLAAENHGGLKLPDGSKIDFGTGMYVPSISRKLCHEYARFWFLWFKATIAVLWLTGKKPMKQGGKNVLIFGIPDSFFNDANGQSKIDDYLRGDPIQPLCGANHYILQISRAVAHKTARHPTRSRFPQIDLIALSDLGVWRRIWLLLGQFGSLIAAHGIFVSHPLTTLFASDFALLTTMRRLEKWGFYSSITVTTSDTNRQPIWMRPRHGAELHFLHYAALPLFAIDKMDPFPEEAEKEVQMLFVADQKHWVWSEYEKKLLNNRYGHRNCEVSGLPSFLLTEGVAKPAMSAGPTLRIIIFDVTPATVEHARSIGAYFYYGVSETAVALVDDVLETARMVAANHGIELEIRLKQKRAPEAIHVQKYIDFLQQKAHKYTFFEVAPPTTPINEVVSADSVVISRPYTSAAVVAESLGARSVFYDPTMKIIDNCPAESNISLLQGRYALERELSSHIKKARHAGTSA